MERSLKTGSKPFVPKNRKKKVDDNGFSLEELIPVPVEEVKKPPPDAKAPKAHPSSTEGKVLGNAASYYKVPESLQGLLDKNAEPNLPKNAVSYKLYEQEVMNDQIHLLNAEEEALFE